MSVSSLTAWKRTRAGSSAGATGGMADLLEDDAVPADAGQHRRRGNAGRLRRSRSSWPSASASAGLGLCSSCQAAARCECGRTPMLDCGRDDLELLMVPVEGQKTCQGAVSSVQSSRSRMVRLPVEFGDNPELTQPAAPDYGLLCRSKAFAQLGQVAPVDDPRPAAVGVDDRLDRAAGPPPSK